MPARPRLLLADDNDDVRSMARLAHAVELAELDPDILEAGSGDQAITLCRAQSVDVLLLAATWGSGCT